MLLQVSESRLCAWAAPAVHSRGACRILLRAASSGAAAGKPKGGATCKCKHLEACRQRCEKQKAVLSLGSEAQGSKGRRAEWEAATEAKGKGSKGGGGHRGGSQRGGGRRGKGGGQGGSSGEQWNRERGGWQGQRGWYQHGGGSW